MTWGRNRETGRGPSLFPSPHGATDLGQRSGKQKGHCDASHKRRFRATLEVR